MSRWDHRSGTYGEARIYDYWFNVIHHVSIRFNNPIGSDFVHEVRAASVSGILMSAVA